MTAIAADHPVATAGYKLALSNRYKLASVNLLELVEILACENGLPSTSANAMLETLISILACHKRRQRRLGQRHIGFAQGV